MGAVTIEIVGAEGIRGEVDACDDAAIAIVIVQVGMGGDAAIDHRYRHAIAPPIGRDIPKVTGPNRFGIGALQRAQVDTTISALHRRGIDLRVDEERIEAH